MDERQRQTMEAFGFLWKKREAYESEHHYEKYRQWLTERYFGTDEARRAFLAEREGGTILDAGCGSGFSSLLLWGDHLDRIAFTGVDLSEAMDVAKERFAEKGVPGHFLRDNIQTMSLGETFDVIFSEGVIHHTSDPVAAFGNLVAHLAPGGHLLFYVYKKKAPIREFSDDWVREQLRPLDDEAAWKALLPLTRLGQALGELQVDVEVPEAVDILGIPKGRYDVQRLFYWFVAKAYYDPKFSLDEMNLYNFDWYRPLNCYRYEPEEVRGWLTNASLETVRFEIEEAGITVVARKPI